MARNGIHGDRLNDTIKATSDLNNFITEKQGKAITNNLLRMTSRELRGTIVKEFLDGPVDIFDIASANCDFEGQDTCDWTNAGLEVYPVSPSTGLDMFSAPKIDHTTLGDLNVYMYPVTDGDDLSLKQPVYQLTGPQTGLRVWLQVNIDYIAQENFEIALEFVEGNTGRYATAVDDLTVVPSHCPVPDLSFNCTFEEGSCGWIQSEFDDFNWLLEQGRTPSTDLGPVIDHTRGDGNGRYYFFQATGLFTSQYAVLLSPLVNSSDSQDGSLCFSFWYNMFGINIEELEVVVTTNLTEPLGTFIYRIYKEQTSQDVWLQAMVDIVNQTEDFHVGLVGRVGGISSSEIGIDDVSIIPGLCPQGNQAFNCTFEDGYCGWTQREGDGDNWIMDRASTKITSTGPDFDHTLGDNTGRYMYFSPSQFMYTPIFESPVVEVNGENGLDLCFSFWYNMNGRYIGTLEVYSYNATGSSSNTSGSVKVFSASGPQTGRRGWLHGLVDIRDVNSNIRFYFRGVPLGTRNGDIAFDDVSLQRGLCEKDTNFNCTFEEGSLCGWVRSDEDDKHWQLQRGATDTANTGPDFDHTTGTIEGSYLYLEATVATTAILLSPVVTPPVTDALKFVFWYNMYGDATGTLNVLKVPEIGNLSSSQMVYSMAGQQTADSTWLKAEVFLLDLTSSFQIVLQANRGVGISGRSDIAIDDLEITSNIGEIPIVTTDVQTTTAVDELSTSEQTTGVATSSNDETSTSEAPIQLSTTDHGTEIATTDETYVTDATPELTTVEGITIVLPTDASIDQTSTAADGGDGGVATTGSMIDQTSVTDATLELTTVERVTGVLSTDASIDQTSIAADRGDGGVATTGAMIDQTSVTDATPELTTVERVTGVLPTDASIDQTSTAADGGDGEIATTGAMIDQTSTSDGGNGGIATTSTADGGESSTVTEGTMEFSCQLRILELNGALAVFNDRLTDSNSQEFRDVANIIRPAVIAALRRSPRTSNVVDYEVISVRDGSLLVNGVARFPLNSVIESAAIREVLHSEAMSNNGLIDNSLTIDLSGTVVTAPTEVCPAYVCQNGGVCTQSGSFPDYVYTCGCSDGYTGTYCEETVPGNGGIIAIATTVGALLLCSIVVMICVCAIMANRSEGPLQRRRRFAQQEEDHARERYRYGVRNWTRPAIMPRTVLEVDDGSMDDARAFYRTYDYSTNYRREDGFSRSYSPYMIPGPALMRKMDQERMTDDYLY
ncbi:MAM and LDL-receptor class A domain-containing protein 1-like [Patiria miniata]|uniref:Uncharacterized protein n=1 Tax=Patiria miniata TaxID=46514 RepID=A0A913ZNZ2_PATMI|nr:MAM and LDL-receptor class A domain-containing protein 1-like [Patiria miniata]